MRVRYLSGLPGGTNGVATYTGEITDTNPLPPFINKNAIQNEVNHLGLPTGGNQYIYIFMIPSNYPLGPTAETASLSDFSGANGKNWDHNWTGMILDRRARSNNMTLGIRAWTTEHRTYHEFAGVHERPRQ